MNIDGIFSPANWVIASRKVLSSLRFFSWGSVYNDVLLTTDLVSNLSANCYKLDNLLLSPLSRVTFESTRPQGNSINRTLEKKNN